MEERGICLTFFVKGGKRVWNAHKSHAPGVVSHWFDEDWRAAADAAIAACGGGRRCLDGSTLGAAAGC